MFAGYELNKDYIAKVLCENKAKPMMHCNGKCFLAKKIKQAEEEQQKQQQQQSLAKHIFADVFLASQQKFKCFTCQTDEFLPANTPSYLFRMPRGIFHPPNHNNLLIS